MHDVTVRSRPDGIVELAPKLAPLEAEDRLLVIVTVLLSAAGFFLSGMMPAEVLAAIAASCLAGEVILGIKAGLLALLRPRADVHVVSAWRGRRRSGRP